MQRKLSLRLFAALAAALLPAAAWANAFPTYPTAKPLTGNEILSPIEQYGQTVSAPLSMIANEAASIGLVTPNLPGAIARSPAAHFADDINVRDFGAVCDGVTDDTAAFASAQAAISVRPYGAHFLVPAGDCLLSNAPSFSLSGSQTEAWEGEAGGATTLTISGTGFDATLTSGANAVSFRNLTMVHTSARGGTAITVLRTTNPIFGGTDDFTNLVIEGVSRGVSFQNGIVTTGENGATFDNDQISLPDDSSGTTTAGDGIAIYGVNAAFYAIDNKFVNDVMQGGSRGIQVGPFVQGIFWDNSEAVGNDYGVYWVDPLTGNSAPELLKVTGGHMNTHVAGVFTQNVQQNMVSDVLFLNFANTTTSVWDAVDMDYTSDTTITGNSVQGTGAGTETAFALTNTQQATVTGNQVTYLQGPCGNFRSSTKLLFAANSCMAVNVASPFVAAGGTTFGANIVNGASQLGPTTVEGNLSVNAGGALIFQSNGTSAGYVANDTQGGVAVGSLTPGSPGNLSAGGNITAGINQTFITRDSTGNAGYIGPDGSGGLTVNTARVNGVAAFAVPAGSISAGGNVSAGVSETFITRDSTGNAGYVGPDGSGGLVVGTARSGGVAQLAAGQFRQTGFSAPASSSAACTAGQFGFASGYFYACVATNTWQRAALASF